MKKMLALLLATTLTAASLAGCGGGGETSGDATNAATEAAASGETAAPVASDGSLKLAVTTGDGSTTDDRIPTPWYNRILATNLMYRGLFLADSTLTEVEPIC